MEKKDERREKGDGKILALEKWYNSVIIFV